MCVRGGGCIATIDYLFFFKGERRMKEKEKNRMKRK